VRCNCDKSHRGSRLGDPGADGGQCGGSFLLRGNSFARACEMSVTTFGWRGNSAARSRMSVTTFGADNAVIVNPTVAIAAAAVLSVSLAV
jgi:hypothetical protein